MRRRVLAFTGVWFLVAGLLTALSLVVVVFIASALMLLAGIAAGGLRVLRRQPIREVLQTARASTEQSSRRLSERRRDVDLRRRARRAGRGTGALLMRSGQFYARTVYRLPALAAKASTLSPRPPGSHRKALRLNERGAQLRRRGNPEQAVEQHRVALEIVRELGDQRAEAMTLNNLGLAFAQGGAETVAVQYLEQAATVLRELGDEVHEGQVIANLGLVHRRQGHSEEAMTLLHEALDKLPPESPAYRKVEEQLQRAS